MSIARHNVRVLVLGVMLAAASSSESQTTTRYAAVGESATGSVVRETSDQLQISTKPCANAAAIVIFHQPLVKDPAGSITCSGKKLEMFQVIQK